MKRFAGITAAFGLLLAVAGCEAQSTTQGVYMLLDTSGTYTAELKKAQQIISAILTKLEPGDSFAVARIDTGSFSEKDIIAKVTLDDRPSVANQQKRIFQQEIDDFVRSVKPAQYTDITGGILQASEFLLEKGVGRRRSSQSLVVHGLSHAFLPGSLAVAGGPATRPGNAARWRGPVARAVVLRHSWAP